METSEAWPRRLLVTASTFPRYRGDSVPDFVWKQVREFKRLRPEVSIHVMAPHDPGCQEEEQWEGVRIHRIRYLPEHWQRIVYPAIYPKLLARPWLAWQVPCLMAGLYLGAVRLIRQHLIDCVYSHWFMPQGVACGIAALQEGIPHALTAHASDVSVMGRIPMLGPLVVRGMLPTFRAITVDGSSGVPKMRRFFPHNSPDWPAIESRLQVLPMGVDGDCIPSLEGRGAVDPRRLLFLGRFSEKKGVEVLLEAIRVLGERGWIGSLVLAGSGPLEARLRRMVERLGLEDRVEFCGYVDEDRKRRLFAESGVLIVPSIQTRDGDAEGLPVVLLEGLAAGLIPVATHASGAVDVLGDSGTGILVEERDPSALAEAIESLTKLSAHELARRRAGAESLGRRFLWSQMAQRHWQFLFGEREAGVATKTS